MRRNRYRHDYGKSYDKSKLNELFKRLRSMGYVARQDFSCCGSCACYELSVDYGKHRDAGKWEKVKGAVYYHRQDKEGLEHSGGVYLGFGRLEYRADGKDPKYVSTTESTEVGRDIVKICDELDICTEWDGTEFRRVYVDLTKPRTPSFVGEGI